jgi:uncharacterized protein YbaR (Trm112 family)
MHKRLANLLVCPKCKGSLQYQAGTKELVCTNDLIAFPVRKGVPILLEMDARKLEPIKS